jgi:hypothetical protein
VLFVWIAVAFVGVAALWHLYGDRVRAALAKRSSGCAPESRPHPVLVALAAAAAVAGLTFAILLAVNNSMATPTNCRTVFDPTTGGDVLSCRTEGGLDWLPRWIKEPPWGT